MSKVFNRPVTDLKGVGTRKAALFAKLGIYTLRDLLEYYPRSYIDLTKPTPIAALNSGTSLAGGESAVIVGKIVSDILEKRIRRDMNLYRFEVSDTIPEIDGGAPSPTDTIRVTLFNQKYLAASLHRGQTITLYGKISGYGILKEMHSPMIYLQEETGMKAVYPLKKDTSQKMISSSVAMVLNGNCGSPDSFLPEILPESVLRKEALIGRLEAHEKIHRPQSGEDLDQARRRLAYEELFIFRLGLSVLKQKNTLGTSHSIRPPTGEELKKLFPFELTDAQKKAINEALTDMKKSCPMSRMVQGDVGSGKTAVAAALCYATIRNGFQSCLMVPTEILAVQHYRDLSKMLSAAGVRVELLTGSTSSAKKKDLLSKLEEGEIDLLIGTHALIETGVRFRSLGLAVIDEQHRFGVRQRSLLSEKTADGFSPHMLLMSATPIPRSLALILYGDLSLSIIDTLPKGRQKVSTFLLGSNENDRLYSYVAEEVKKGFQAYIVCPLVEEGEDETVKDVEGFYQELKNKYFSEIPADFLHGKMNSKDKDRILKEFSENEIGVLVSTTVVEVGVNVPNATIMIIQNAERFGLSQLHQLRGRVGRGEHKAYCFLISDGQEQKTQERLKSLCETSDGFLIARKDLEQRGPGDFFGQRQHGLPEFKMANFITDMDLINTASEDADAFTKTVPDWINDPQYEPLRTAVSGFFARSDSNNGNVNL